MASTPPFSPHVSISEMGQKAVESWNSVGQQWLWGDMAAWVDPWTQSLHFPFQSLSAKGWSGAPQGVSVRASCKSCVSFTSKAKSPPILSFSAEQQEDLCSNLSLAPRLESGGITHPSVAGAKGYHCPDTAV